VRHTLIERSDIMNILVANASRHGGTREIAEVLAEELQAAGYAADMRDVAEVKALDVYDAVILGSGVYMGNWLPEARQFVERHRAELARLPLWMFSSGPLGAPDPKPTGDPERISDLLRETPHREHRVFTGRLDKHELGVGERLVTRIVKAPEGDFRDWDAIRAWARKIVGGLEKPPAPDQPQDAQATDGVG
jgi:menaquinone-dependent protoporphyrinogen oxidase